MAHGSITEAILFFDDGVVTKEMLFPEFEAVLDGVVQINDFRNKLIKSAFVQIDSHLLITSAVLFLVDFDEQGYADRDWNIPLQHLAYTAGRGPDLGAGPIKLACKSQCPVSWHQAQLWDPDLSPDNNDLAAMRRSAERNNLGILVDSSYTATPFTESAFSNPVGQMPLQDDDFPILDVPILDVPVLGAAEQAATEQSVEQSSDAYNPDLQSNTSKKFDADHRDKIANLIKQQRLRISTLKLRFEQESALHEQQRNQQKEEFKGKHIDQQQELEVLKRQNQTLKSSMKTQLEEFRRSREQLTRQIKDIENDEVNDLERIKAEYETEMAERLQAATAEMQEQLEIRDVEMAYRNELDNQKEAELDELRNKVEDLTIRQSEDVLGDLSEKGVVFVAHHPGVGHITIPLRDIPRYMNHVLEYVSDKCFVPEEQYSNWLTHYESPSCDVRTTDGSRCGVRIDRVESPGIYAHGHSNHCKKHRTFSAVEAVKAARGES